METSIRIARKAAGLTQQQLADRYGIPIRTVVDWDRGVRTPPEYVKNMLLRCLALDFPTAQEVLSEQEPAPKSAEPEPSNIFCDKLGKPLTAELAKIARTEYEAGRVEPIDKHTQDYYGDPVAIASRREKLYLCTEPDLERGIPFGFEFRVVPKGE